MKLKIPKVGMRTIKTAVAVMLSYLLFVPFDLMYREEYGGIWGQMGPLYACIACIAPWARRSARECPGSSVWPSAALWGCWP